MYLYTRVRAHAALGKPNGIWKMVFSRIFTAGENVDLIHLKGSPHNVDNSVAVRVYVCVFYLCSYCMSEESAAEG